jgi:DNA transformation protein
MDREFLIDLFAGFGPVTIRRMFSGFGISADGINFALALRSGLYLRADEASFGKFEAAGSKPFSYETRARTMTVRSYWQVPAHLFDDTDEFAVWAREAFAAAQTAALSKRTRTKRGASRSKLAPREAKPRATKKSVKKAKSAKTRKAAKSVGKAAGKSAAAARKTRRAVASRTR